jgi:lipoprotein-anchoring transpeptidase ErfK/SrfK
MRDNEGAMSDQTPSSSDQTPAVGGSSDSLPAEATPAARRDRRRLVLAAVAGAIPLVPIVIALSLSSGGGGAPTATAGSLYTPVTQTPAKAVSRPAKKAGALVAIVRRPSVMRAAPAGHAFARVGLRTEFGSPEAMWVVRRSGQWLGVISQLAGNGKVGWIPAGAASLVRVDWQLKVSLATRRLTVLLGGRVLERYRVAIGAPVSPTPTGRFAVTDRLRTGDPSGPYGCCILALSAQAPHVIQGWSGGNRIAIHSTPETSTIGEPVSHGCMRLTLAEGRWLLAHIPLGTPTLISS